MKPLDYHLHAAFTQIHINSFNIHYSLSNLSGREVVVSVCVHTHVCVPAKNWLDIIYIRLLKAVFKAPSAPSGQRHFALHFLAVFPIFRIKVWIVRSHVNTLLCHFLPWSLINEFPHYTLYLHNIQNLPNFYHLCCLSALCSLLSVGQRTHIDLSPTSLQTIFHSLPGTLHLNPSLALSWKPLPMLQ